MKIEGKKLSRKQNNNERCEINSSVNDKAHIDIEPIWQALLSKCIQHILYNVDVVTFVNSL